MRLTGMWLNAFCLGAGIGTLCSPTPTPSTHLAWILVVSSLLNFFFFKQIED